MVGKKVYRSSQGKSIDLGALLLQNETVRAVGNMGVNARGDRINIQNKVIDTKNKISQRAYNKQIGPQDVKPQTHASPIEDVVPAFAPDPHELQERNNKEHNAFKAKRKAEKEVAKANKSQKTAIKKTPVITEKILNVEATAPVQPVTPPPPPPAPVVQPTPNPVKEPEPTVQKKATGLADAIARAKTIKQETLKTPRQQAQEKSGVKRI